MASTQWPYRLDDIVVWQDGTWATLGEVWAGDFGWMSDDYEIVRADDVERLKALNLADDLGLP
ncbi:hypothetical protein [Mesorhizobium sp.]|uniref:hypothetical protein n=1 Tax=Mesorhizobium sp. TaxID=1871066 RepID=UPI000FE7EF63|nr:hypothetical protein [Mesorhizobium sp.]RWJ31986.1 MAG: hypothetical protein EOR28_14530 [Mesorhizobium sp.]TIQ73808.1 MAG: hypothetical protein E5X40_05335 [Mesorhizobium sp.]